MARTNEWRRLHGCLARLVPWAGLTRIPLYRSSFALILTTAANAGLGLIFWTLAARLYSTEEVGRGAAAVAALQLASMIGCTGLTPALVRLLPPSRAGTMRLVLGTYAAGVSVAVLAGLCVIVATNLGVEELAVPGYVYLLAIPIFALFTLQDGVLIGLRREGLVPVENAAYGVVKIALLIAFSTAGAWGIFVSWSITALLLVIPVNLLLFIRFIPVHPRGIPNRTRSSALAISFVSPAAITSSGLLMALPDFLMPIIVLQVEGAAENAFFFAAWSLVWPLRLIASNIANAFTAQAAEDDSRARDLLMKAGLLTLAIFAPLVLFLTAGRLSAAPLSFRAGICGERRSRDEAAGAGPPGLRFPEPRRRLRPGEASGGQASLPSRRRTRPLACRFRSLLISWQGIDGAGLAWLLSQARWRS